MSVQRAGDAPLLQVDGLQIVFPGSAGAGPAVDKVSFELQAGESLAIVGESGSGKTLIGKSLLGLLPDAARVRGGSILYEGRELLGQGAQAWRQIRGTGIGMVFQEPMVSLNPAFRVGQQLTEALILRRGLGRAQAWEAAVAMLERVRVRDARACMRRYPHEFSGGMRQRILLAGVMLLQPKLLIADEPTTALDCIVQKEVLDLMLELVREQGAALIFISHNLALVAAYTQRVLVMCRGRAVEAGPVRQVLSRPADSYTLNLLDALPRRGAARAPEACAEPILSVRDLVVEYPVRGNRLHRRMARAVRGVGFCVAPGETLAVVGESGSGKTTVMMAVLGLIPHAQGEIVLGGRRLANADRRGWHAARQRVQMIFQDPYSSLDPRMCIEALVGEGLRKDASLSAGRRRERVAQVLSDVGLGAAYAKRYVHELSGGQRQRVAIARALVLRPELVIADEPVSALDVTVQKQVLETLASLQRDYRFACLFVSHDLGVVEQLADRVAVMLHGHIVEEGTRDEIFDRPAHPYTRRLLQAVPELRGNREGGFRVETRTLAGCAGGLPEDAYFVPDPADSAAPRMTGVAASGPAHRVALLAT